MKTGLVLRIPEADALFAGVQELLSPGFAPAMPAHVTVLFPFRAWEALDDVAFALLADLFGRIADFELAFTHTARFPGVAWLAPEPRGLVDRLTQSVFETFPDCLPYCGQFEDPTPHLTLAEGDEPDIERAVAFAAARLQAPINAKVTHCSLFVLAADGWRRQLDFALAATAMRDPVAPR